MNKLQVQDVQCRDPRVLLKTVDIGSPMHPVAVKEATDHVGRLAIIHSKRRRMRFGGRGQGAVYHWLEAGNMESRLIEGRVNPH
uniref:Uncharacterized protein n=1 Tax=Anguilla anguilla TaxID=7936 RepID=A0A0E9PCF7_ANGAN